MSRIISLLCIAALASGCGDDSVPGNQDGDAGTNSNVLCGNGRVEGIEARLGAADLASDSMLVLRSGKKRYALLRFA